MLKKVLAIDFGASSGRAILGSFDGSKITLEEIHRFSNDPVTVGGTVYWDVLRLFHEIKQSLLKCKLHGGADSIGIDTWGVDFGLIDAAGRLLENPVHYRDSRTNGLSEKSFELIPKEEFYAETGNQFMDINTAFQLLSVVNDRPELMQRTDKLLMMPDLFGYFLTGKKHTELSMASTSQLFNPQGRCWSEKVISKLGIKQDIFPEIITPGTKIGTILPEICDELDIEPMDVIAVCGHDTQSAMAAVPALEESFAFLSCGTWSLLGTELDQPLLSPASLELNITNEMGYGCKASFLKNITGLWLIQESRRQWAREGSEYSYAELEQMALAADSGKCFIDPDNKLFASAGNIPERIRKFCAATGQYVPQTTGEIMRCIYESLALKYRFAIEELSACTGRSYPVLYMIGGGTKDRFLPRLTANVCKCRVSVGPVEATALGNIIVQLISCGSIESLEEARKIVINSESITTFECEDGSSWDSVYEKYLSIIRTSAENL